MRGICCSGRAARAGWVEHKNRRSDRTEKTHIKGRCDSGRSRAPGQRDEPGWTDEGTSRIFRVYGTFAPVVLSYPLLEARQKLLANSATDPDWTDLDEKARGVHIRETGRATGRVLQAWAGFGGLNEYAGRHGLF